MEHLSTYHDGEDNLDGIKSALPQHSEFLLRLKGVNLSSLHDEIEKVVDHVRRYRSTYNICYQKVWYRLHTPPDSSKWPNILLMFYCVSFYSAYYFPVDKLRESSQH